jgi:hypothetical protein
MIDHGRSAPTDRGYTIDQTYTRWLKQKVTAEQEYMPPRHPAKTLQEIYANVPPEMPLKQTTSSMVCGGKREMPLTYDPDIRQADPVSRETVLGQAQVDTPTETPPDDFEEAYLELAQPEEEPHAQCCPTFQRWCHVQVHSNTDSLARPGQYTT